MEMFPMNHLTFTARTDCRYDCLRLQAMHANIMLNVKCHRPGCELFPPIILILLFDFTPISGVDKV